jgi:methylmalonyl-CoA mutase
MLDFADAVAINKFERRGADDALRDVRRQLQRNRESFNSPLEDLPVFGTIAARFNDDGVTALYQHLAGLLGGHGLPTGGGGLGLVDTRVPTGITAIVPPARSRYLADVAESVREYHRGTEQQVVAARRRQALRTTRDLLADQDAETSDVDRLLDDAERALDGESHALLDDWPATVEAYSATSMSSPCATARSARRSRTYRCRARMSRGWRCPGAGVATTGRCCGG